MAQPPDRPADLEAKLTSLAKRRGFYWPAFELYGGAGGLYDYGPLGAAMKQNIENLWRAYFVLGEGFAEIACPTLTPEPVFKASGHLEMFSDLLVECGKCGEAYRADHLLAALKVDAPPGLTPGQTDQLIAGARATCPACGGELSNAHPFNLMFRTTLGPGARRPAYLRPETAQGMFVTFPQISRHFRDKLPFGAVQIGTSYRNEIAPRQGVLRMREFHQMEAEIFVHPDEKRHPRFPEVADELLALVPADGLPTTVTARDAAGGRLVAHELLAYYLAFTQRFLVDAGIDPARLHFRQHAKTEMAHYAIDCWDAEVLLAGGWVEVVGIADRTNFDLTAHAKHSGTTLEVFLPFDTPKVVRGPTVVPDRRALGPAFRARGNAIADALAATDPRTLPATGPVHVRLPDGTEADVPREMITIEERERRETGVRIVPHVIEPAFGVDRILYAALEHAFREEVKENEPYIVLRLSPRVAPGAVAVLPLMPKDGLDVRAQEIRSAIAGRGIANTYDDSGTIGKRYARSDEAGTPLALTVDYDTLTDGTVTLRDRDSAAQVRLPADAAVDAVAATARGALRFAELQGRWVAAGAARIRS